METPGDPLLFFGGAALCLAVVSQAALGVVGFFRDRAQQRSESDAQALAFRDEVTAAAESANARLANRLGWDGRRTLRVSAVVEETDDIKSFYLTDPEGLPLPSYLPGQYVTLATPAGPNGAEVIRCYSLSDRSRPEYYRITVRRQTAPANAPDTPDGLASCWLHDHVKKGSELSCEAPRGVFFYNPRQPRPAALVGAGVGVTPLVAMLEALHHRRAPTPTLALFGFRNGASAVFAERAREIAAADPSVRVRIAHSQPEPNGRLGADYDIAGRISVDALVRELPTLDFDFYLCGPAAMMQTLAVDLLAAGVTEDAIHFEAFGPASVNLSGPSPLEKAIGSTVQFAPDSEPVVWDGVYKSLLELAESLGVPVGSGCRAGNCGACRLRVAEGKVRPLRESGAAVDADECLACISLPDGPVRLEA